jgi:pyridoxal phosphate enzyme (YggS family)
MLVNPEDIRNNYNIVLDRISRAARIAGRDPDEIHLVVVTKTHPIDVVQAVIEAGANHLGENYVEEAIPKIVSMHNIRDIKWHMIGHVQSRKARSVCEYFHYMHSLDNVKLAERLDRFSKELGQSIPVWLEVNTSGEASKNGWNICFEEQWGSILTDIKQIIALPNVDIQGLMTMPPFSDNPEDARPFYKRLRRFQEYLTSKIKQVSWRELSMGMSVDFEVAIQEGATWVRIGQAILGSRSR